MGLLTVKCPRCKHDMLYQPHGGDITKKSKVCVYCGCSFKVHGSMPKSRIVSIS